MAILAFQKPDKVLMLEADSKFGKFEFRPLEPGFGITVGNALRRILLSSLEGFAITTIKIEGVEHEFSSVPGVKEDVTNIILNLKQVRFKQIVEEFESEKVSITVENSSEFKAGDIGKYLTGFEVLNPELVICHLDPKSTMQMDITINKGRGYVPADENRDYCTEVNAIPIDSIYTPIRNVKYQIEPYRVEQKTDYDKLVLEITTDGSIHPKEALKEAAKILIYHFMLFSDEKITLETNDADGNEEFDEEVLHMRQLLKTKLVDMDLSVRALNCLKAADVETLGDLVMACSLIKHKRITTTVAKAKALKKYVEPLLTKSKNDTTNSRRVVFSYLQDKYAITELFKEISVKIADRPGGYTRIIKTGHRLGDNAEMCFIELVDYNENMAKDKAAKKVTRTRRSKKNAAAAPAEVAAETPAAEDTKTEAAAE